MSSEFVTIDGGGGGGGIDRLRKAMRAQRRRGCRGLRRRLGRFHDVHEKTIFTSSLERHRFMLLSKKMREHAS